MKLSITDVAVGQNMLVQLQGHLDTVTAREFEAHVSQLLRNGAKRIAIDLGDLAYVSSFGLRMFLLFAKQLRSDSRAFVLARPTPEVAKIFNVTGFDKILTIRNSVDEAVAMISE